VERFFSGSDKPKRRFGHYLGYSMVYDSQRQETGYTFDIRQLKNDGRYASTVIEHDIGNAYCNPLADMTYASQQDLYQNGTDSYSKVDLVFNHRYVAPECLGGVFGG
jgi:hypothetical protein